MKISSSQNTTIKRLRALYKDKKLRKEENVFICEGVNLIKDIPAYFLVEQLFIAESKEEKLAFLAERIHITPQIVEDKIFDAVCDTKTPSGAVAIVKKPYCDNTLDGEIVLLLDGISDSGNLGTIIRSAAARGIQSVICADCCDAFSPKCIRSAMSGTFFTNIIETDRKSALDLLSNYSIVGLDMGGNCIYSYKRQGKIALTVGSEAHGISEEVRNEVDEFLSIPMENGVESLNAAISISIAMYMIK